MQIAVPAVPLSLPSQSIRTAALYDQPYGANRACMITVRFRPHLQPTGHQRGCSGASDARPAAPPCTNRRLSEADWELLSPHHCIFSIRLLYQIKAVLSTIVLHNLIYLFLLKLCSFPVNFLFLMESHFVYWRSILPPACTSR